MKTLLSALVIALTATIATADPTRLGLGIAFAPQYEGAKDYRVIAAPSFTFSLGQVNVRSSGPGVEVDLFASRGFDAGPIVRWNGGRDPSKIDNAQVSALPKIDGSVMFGGFVQLNYPVGDSTFLATRVDVLKGIGGGNEGFLAEASVGLTKRSKVWTFGGRAGLTYADATYMDTVFGVGAASPSGLSAFTADAGIKDFGLTAFANYQVSDQWSVTGIAGVKRLVGDAANSPITSVTGSDTQGFLSLGVSYTFQ